MKQKKILAMLLSFVMIFSMLTINRSVYAEGTSLPKFSGGTGTETDPFLLANADDLTELRDSVNNQTDDTLIDSKDTCGLGCYHGYYFKLTKDIDMAGVTDWTPFNFCGVLDGAGHTISNMQMNQNFFESADPNHGEYKSKQYEAGFFSQLIHAHIKNLYFENCTATVSDNLAPAPDRDIYAAIVAGSAIASSFENISVVNCTVSQNGKSENMGYAAGLVAFADICHISGCSLQGGSVEVNNNYWVNYTGGLVGAVGDMYDFYKNTFNMQVGAGNAFGIYNSFSTAAISVQSTTGIATGGLIGMVDCDYLDFTCESCMVGGKITASTNVAGLIGICSLAKKTTLNNCVVYSESITGSKYADSVFRISGDSYDGKITVTECKVSGETTVSATAESGSVTNLGNIEPSALTDSDCQVTDFKSNLYGKLNDGSSAISITLSQNDEVKYTAVTDADGEYNFGKQIAKGDYVLKIASSTRYKEYESNVAIDYATNKKFDITREEDLNTITNLAIEGWTYGDTPKSPTSTAKYGTPTYSYSDSKDGTYTNTVPTYAGTYWVKATVAESENYAEVSSEPISFKIAQVIPTENPEKKTTARVRRGGTLAEATVTEGEFLGLDDTVLKGTFSWDGDTTEVISADCTRQMKFTPTDTNYAPITFDVAVSTYSSSGGSSTTRYTVKFDTDGGNTITSQTVTKNSKATEPTKPTKEGYIFDGWYTDSKFENEYDFDTKVTKNITLYAKWVEDEVQEPSDDNTGDEQKPTPSEWKNPFTDVTSADWFFDNVKYAHENGLMSGVTNTEFAPNEVITRGMFVTVLYRAEGEPAVNKSVPFVDVDADMYYANAVIWAQKNGIVSGISETEFAPDQNITREQIAAIVYRYAQFKGYDVTQGGMQIREYEDCANISDYAINAMTWAVNTGLMKGKTETTLNPKDNATRAEIAAILHRFLESVKSSETHH